MTDERTRELLSLLAIKPLLIEDGREGDAELEALRELGLLCIAWDDAEGMLKVEITEPGRARWRELGGFDPLVTSVAAFFAQGGVWADDDGECLLIDIELDRDPSSWCGPERALVTALHDDRFWAMMLQARSQIEMARVAAKGSQ